MSIEGEIRQMASEATARLQKHAAYLHQKYIEAQKHAMELKAQFDAANLAQNRLTNFQVKIGADYQCPRCWIEREIRTPFFAVPGESRKDILRCHNGHELIITY